MPPSRPLAEAVRAKLQQPLGNACQGWDKRWDAQINNYFNVATAVLPLGGSAQTIDQTLARLLTGKASFGEALSQRGGRPSACPCHSQE